MSFAQTWRLVVLVTLVGAFQLGIAPRLQAQDLADPASIAFDSLQKQAGNPAVTGEQADPIKPEVNAPNTLPPEKVTTIPVVPNMPLSIRTSVPANLPAVSGSTMPAKMESKTHRQPSAPGVLPDIQVVYPESINLNVPSKIRLVASCGSMDLSSAARLTVVLPAHLELVQSAPQPGTIADLSVVFDVPALTPDKPMEIALEIIAREKKPVSLQTRVEIASEGEYQLDVRQPVLELRLDGSSQGILGQPSQMELVVRNTGDGTADQLNIELNLPEGCVADAAALEQLVRGGSLAPGEEARFQVSTRMMSDGVKKVTAVARALGAESGSQEMGMNVIRPELELAVSAPEITWVNSRAWFSFTVTNPSPIDIDQAVVVLKVPTLAIQTISVEAAYDDQAHTLIWNIGTVPAGQAVEFQMVATAPESGPHKLSASLESRLTEQKELSIDTTARARANLAVSVVQVENPAPVGLACQYLVVVENRGTEAASGIDARVELPAEWVVESSENCRVANGAAAFVVDSIAPGERREIAFVATCTVAGESLLRAVARHEETQYTASSENSMLLYQANARRVAETTEPRMIR